MRMMLKVHIPVETGNAAAREGTLGQTISSILDDLKPEAAYFCDDMGYRTGILFFEMKDSSEIPAVAEPWMLAFDAEIEMHPVMNPDDLRKAGDSIKKSVEKYG